MGPVTAATTAGSLALEGARARRDATVVKLLRAAGAVILGKANLTEFANMLAIGMPSGYSSLGGRVKNPYAPALMNDHGIPVVLPGGSSSGSAVAVAAGLCAASIGTETSGSLLHPASMNGLVTVKPTVGLISRAGILPLAHSQDTAGPMTRTVRDAAVLLNVLAAKDLRDPATQRQRRPGRLHRRPRERCDEGRAHRRAERSCRPAERLLLRQAAAQVGSVDERTRSR